MTVSEAIEVDGGSPVVLYRLYNSGDALLYVGVTSDPGGRLAAHARDKPWWPDVTRKTAALCASREAALRAERAAVRDEHPRHNVRLQCEAPPAIPEDPEPAVQAEPLAADGGSAFARLLETSRMTRASLREVREQLEAAELENCRQRHQISTLISALGRTQRDLQRAECPHPAHAVRDGQCRWCRARLAPQETAT